MKNEIILSSLAMDLKRVAIGINRGSFKMAERFCEEAMERKQELDLSNLKQYIKNLAAPYYYVAGPPGMVAGTTQLLIEIGVKEDNIKFEEFAGY